MLKFEMIKMCNYPFTYKRTIIESLMCGGMFVVARQTWL